LGLRGEVLNPRVIRVKNKVLAEVGVIATNQASGLETALRNEDLRIVDHPAKAGGAQDLLQGALRVGSCPTKSL
jgi:hypothetical protein